MSELDIILEKLRDNPITGLDPPAKQQIKDLFVSIVEQYDYVTPPDEEDLVNRLEAL